MRKIKRITRLLECLEHPLRFNQILVEAKTNPKTLSEDLKFCSEMEMVRRKVKTSPPIRCEYSITPHGREVKKCFDQLTEMGI